MKKSCLNCKHGRTQEYKASAYSREGELLCFSDDQRNGRLKGMLLISGGVHLMFHSRNKIVNQDQIRMMLAIADGCDSFERIESGHESGDPAGTATEQW